MSYHPSDYQIGFALAVLSAVFNGSFGVFGKLSETPHDPVIFSCFLTYGALLSSIVAALLHGLLSHDHFEIAFTLWGVLAGAVFVFAILFTFIAIPLAGLARSSATWCSSAVIVSFLWGAIGPTSPPRQPMKNAVIGILAVVIIICGILVITFASKISKIGRTGQRLTRSEDEASGVHSSNYESMGAESADERTDDTDQQWSAAVSDQTVGLLSAVVVGLFGGSVLV